MILEFIKDNLSDHKFSIGDLKQLEKLKEIADSTLRGEIKKLSNFGYIDWNGEMGRNSRYKFIDIPKDFLKLPTPEELSSIYSSLIAQTNEYKAIKLI